MSATAKAIAKVAAPRIGGVPKKKTGGLGPCSDPAACALCLAAKEMGEWVWSVARNAYIDGCQPWIISDMFSDIAQIPAKDIQKHATAKRWHYRRDDNLESVRNTVVWNIMLNRYKQYRNIAYTDQTPDKMVELMAKAAGLIGGQKSSRSEDEISISWEDRLLRIKTAKEVEGLDGEESTAGS